MRLDNNVYKYIYIAVPLMVLVAVSAFFMWYYDVQISGLQVILVVVAILGPILGIIAAMLFSGSQKGKKDKTVLAVKSVFDQFNSVYKYNLLWEAVKFERKRCQTSEDNFEDFVAVRAKSSEEGLPWKVIYFNMTTNELWSFDDRPTDSVLANPWRDFDPLKTKQGFWYRKKEEKEAQSLPIQLSAPTQNYNPPEVLPKKKKKKKRRSSGYG